MTPYYLDASALIKHYVAELGSPWLDSTVFQEDDVLLVFAQAEGLLTDNPNFHA